MLNGFDSYLVGSTQGLDHQDSGNVWNGVGIFGLSFGSSWSMLGFPQSPDLKINAGSFVNFHLKYPYNSQSLHFQNCQHEVTRSHRSRD